MEQRSAEAYPRYVASYVEEFGARERLPVVKQNVTFVL